MDSVREDFAEYCVMVETELEPLEEVGVFDHSTFNVPIMGISECSPEEIPAKLEEYDQVKALRIRCRKYWPLKIAKRKIQQVVDYQATEFVDEEELQKLMVATMLVMIHARECITNEIRQKYTTLLMKLRIAGKISRELLREYGFMEGLSQLIANK